MFRKEPHWDAEVWSFVYNAINICLFFCLLGCLVGYKLSPGAHCHLFLGLKQGYYLQSPQECGHGYHHLGASPSMKQLWLKALLKGTSALLKGTSVFGGIQTQSAADETKSWALSKLLDQWLQLISNIVKWPTFGVAWLACA